MGVALDGGTIHVGTGISLVSVADNVLGVSGSLHAGLPLDTSGESCSTTAPQARLLHFLHNFFRLHLKEHLFQRQIAVTANVLVDVLRIDEAAVPQGHTQLLLVELNLLNLFPALLFLIVQQAGNLTSHDNLLGNNLRGILRLYLHVEGVLRQHLYDWPLLTEAEAASLYNLYAVADTLLCSLLQKPLVDGIGAAGFTGTSATNKNKMCVRHGIPPLQPISMVPDALQ